MILFCSRTFYSLLSSLVINVVTTPSDVTDVTVWQITSNSNPRVLKIEKWKINWNKNKNEKENKKKLSLLSVILTLATFPVLMRFYKILFIMVWNVARKLVSLKNITIGSNNPSGIVNTTFYLSLSFIHTLL